MKKVNRQKKVKNDKEIIAIIGNPPYNISTQNVFSKDNILKKFHKTYKPKGEKKLNLDDDYIKFIAFSHYKINQSKRGVIGIIVNNSFLGGLTHREMRNKLLKDFQKIMIIDLHGNARIGDSNPDGGIDYNVFDIMQGVCIVFLIKNAAIPENLEVFIIWISTVSDSRKFDFLNGFKKNQLQKLDIKKFNRDFSKTRWKQHRFEESLSFFTSKRVNGQLSKYGNFWGMTEIFEKYGSGVKTDRDDLVIDFEAFKLEAKMKTAFSNEFD